MTVAKAATDEQMKNLRPGSMMLPPWWLQIAESLRKNATRRRIRAGKTNLQLRIQKTISILEEQERSATKRLPTRQDRMVSLRSSLGLHSSQCTGGVDFGKQSVIKGYSSNHVY